VSTAPRVTELGELDRGELDRLVGRYDIALIWLPPQAEIPASYWGAPEAGLAGRWLFARPDTPAHSLLHELAHYVCMTASRRAHLFRDAGGDFDEEGAVCYLQAVLADGVEALSRTRLFRDMDAWGYSFREGSAAGWFAGDGAAARTWLLARELITEQGAPTWRLRTLR
jgi:hypothetical protein